MGWLTSLAFGLVFWVCCHKFSGASNCDLAEAQFLEENRGVTDAKARLEDYVRSTLGQWALSARIADPRM